MPFLVSLIIFLCLGLSAQAGPKETSSSISWSSISPADSFKPDPKWLRKELKKMKLPKDFIEDAISSYQEETYETVLKLNLLGFLAPPQHMDRVTRQSIRETEQFLKANQKIFDEAEKVFNVPPNVISALLWIETRHGDDRGKFHIVSVFLHLLQADRHQNRKYMTQLAMEQNKKREQYTQKDLYRIMRERTKKRHNWAKEQLQALAQIHTEKKLNLKTLRGSFAGAFGIPQFIPSSYRDFAKSSKTRRAPDLYSIGDAVMSVANYLLKHGWSNQSLEAKISALMKYNNSRDYAESILEISKQVAPGKSKIRTGEISGLEAAQSE